MSWLVIAMLIVVGLLFLVLEILVIPGTAVVGIFGFGLMGVGIWQAYATYGAIAGHYTLGGTLLLTIISLYFSLKSKTWDKITLHDSVNSKVNVIEEEKVKPGDTGKTVSRLTPMGKAIINGDYYEVRSSGEFIDPGTKILVTKVSYNKIDVKPQNE
ncbi:MAG: nodulation efficiency protein D (NfeD) [Bacteroidales bacterium]|nr:nodulation efficiency protein D (NfeD) [Bacteroidales bacterium]